MNISLTPKEETPVNSCCMPTAIREQSATVAFQDLAVTASARPDTRGMKCLEGGSFLMGTDSDQAWASDGEGPVREVTIAPFWIDETSVTNAQWQEFIAATGYVTESEKFGWSYVFWKHLTHEAKAGVQGVAGEAQWWTGVQGANWMHPEGPGSNLKKRLDHPVVHISWNDAGAYCAWAGKSLPTEAQWEYAARGGLVQNLYPWGDDLTPKSRKGKPEHRCNIWQGKFPDLDTGADGYTNTAPVRTFAPNGYGLYQMSGNVWEWCIDWFSPTWHRPHSPETRENPQGPQSGTHKIIKGGSFLCHASYCNRYRVAARTANTPDSASSHAGFRCVWNGEGE